MGQPERNGIVFSNCIPDSSFMDFRYPRRALHYATAVLVIIAILLLKCRTAVIGVCISATVLAAIQFAIRSKIPVRPRYKTISLLVGIILVFGNMSYVLSTTKKASSDGRMLIWKIGSGLYNKQPIIGTGFGRFEHDYNLAQADYFKSHSATAEEQKNADYVQSGYNDFIQNGIEGGLIAFLLYLLFFAFLIIRIPAVKFQPASTLILSSENIITGYAGIIAFTAMSIFNFGFEAIPAFAVALLYAGILTAAQQSNSSSGRLTVSRPVQPGSRILSILGLLMLPLCLYLGTSQIRLAKALAKNDDATDLIAQHRYRDAVAILSDLNGELSSNEQYLINKAQIAYWKKDTRSAVQLFTQALEVSSSPDLYIALGKCYSQLKLYSDAEQAFTVAKYMKPSLLEPTFELLQNSLRKKDTSGALTHAEALSRMTPKVASPQAAFYQAEAHKLLKELSEPTHINN